MSDILYLYDCSKSKERYNLEKLQDLESRLVLIAGQSTGNVHVQKFLNVSLYFDNSHAILLFWLGFSYCVYYC